MNFEIENLKKQINEQGEKIDKILASVEKTRKYFVWIFWITIITVVLPVIGLVFAIPNFLSTYSNLGNMSF
jgi:t-SNARE complex subunit (syntaxin)